MCRSVCWSVLILAALSTEVKAQTQRTFSASGSSWTVSTNWSPAVVPLNIDNILIDAGTTSMSLTAADLSVRYLTFTDPNSRVLENATAGVTASNFTLTGVDVDNRVLNVSPSAGFSTFTIQNGSTGALNLVLGVSGNFHVSDGGALVINSSISETGGPRSITQTGNGTIHLGGSNSFTGGIYLNNGTLSLNHANALGSTGTIHFDSGGRLQYTANNTTDYSARFSNDPNQLYNIDTNSENVSFATPLTSVGGSLAKFGAGSLSLNVANTYTSATTVFGGTLNINTDGALGSGVVYVFSGAIDNTSGAPVVITSNNPVYPAPGFPVVFTGSNNLDLGTGGVLLQDHAIITVSAKTLTIGSVNGFGYELTKNGLGTLVVNGFSFLDAFIVTAGTLAVDAGAFAAVEVNSGGTLRGAGSISGPVTVTSGTIRAGSTTGKTLMISNDLTLTGTSPKIGVEITSGTTPGGGAARNSGDSSGIETNNYLDVTGTLTLAPGTKIIVDGTGVTFSATSYSFLVGYVGTAPVAFSIDDLSLFMFVGISSLPTSASFEGVSTGELYLNLNFSAPVPEPVGLLGLAAVALLGWRRIRL